jgi:hypothetical protein
MDLLLRLASKSNRHFSWVSALQKHMYCHRKCVGRSQVVDVFAYSVAGLVINKVAYMCFILPLFAFASF